MSAFSPNGAAITIAATTTSQNAVLPGSGDVVRVFNESDSVAYWAVGNSGITADNTSNFVAPGNTETFTIPGFSYIAIKLETGTGNVRAQRGSGE